MHYAQTIIDAAVAALEPLPSLVEVTSSNMFDAADTPAARVILVTEQLEEGSRGMSPTFEARTMALRITLLIAGDDVQRTMNEVRGEVEAVLPAALEAVADCAYLGEVVPDPITTEQDREILSVNLDYVVEYSTVMGDPSQRV